MTVEIVLLCHAATGAMKRNRFPSHEDALADPACLAALAARTNGRTVSAPARAPRETAAALSAQVEIDPGFDDIDYGRWHGRPIREIFDEDPAGLEAWLTDPASAPHGGESLAALAARVMTALDRQAERETGGGSTVETYVVTHAIVLKVVLARVLGAPLASVYTMDFEPLSSLVLTRGPAQWRLRLKAPAP